jgi:hypothetical protein
MEWTNEKHKGQQPRYGVCTSKKMEETKFEDLTIKLGYPYVYTHQGNCEHLLIFRDLRYSFDAVMLLHTIRSYFKFPKVENLILSKNRVIY